MSDDLRKMRLELLQRLYGKLCEITPINDGSLVALEAAIALEIAPSCTMNAVKTQRRRRGTLDGHSLFRVSKRIRNWLARHQCLMQTATT